jgi:uncharacterized membrane protein YdcZ (DUF606 family)
LPAGAQNASRHLRQKTNMNIKTIVAVILVALGIVVLAYSGISFTTPGKPIDFLGMHIATTDNHFVPPAVGALALVGGIVLLLVKPKRV